jgi:hypothetical protein
MARKRSSYLIYALVSYLASQNWSLAMENVTVGQAHTIALAYLNAERNDEIVLIPSKEREYPFGWVFFGASKKYIQTGEFRYQIPGMGPLVVEHDGSVHPLSTSGSPDSVIAAYLRQWQIRQQH